MCVCVISLSGVSQNLECRDYSALTRHPTTKTRWAGRLVDVETPNGKTTNLPQDILQLHSAFVFDLSLLRWQLSLVLWKSRLDMALDSFFLVFGEFSDFNIFNIILVSEQLETNHHRQAATTHIPSPPPSIRRKVCGLVDVPVMLLPTFTLW